MKRLPLILTCLIVAACGSPDRSPADGSDSSDSKATEVSRTPTQLAAMQSISDVDAMRSGLAAGISEIDEVDGETFVQVCKPVGKRLKETAQKNGWLIGQVAVKYRNPAHSPDPEAEALFTRFESDAALDSLWLRSEHQGSSGWRYLRRITVESACLACHGSKAARPEFVKEKYPEDRAFGFEAGDLRGLYSVFIPDSLRGESVAN